MNQNGVLLLRIYPQGVKATLHYLKIVSQGKCTSTNKDYAISSAALKAFENAGLYKKSNDFAKSYKQIAEANKIVIRTIDGV